VSIDFDSESEAIVGTEDYISPEGINGVSSQVTFASDLWSLGVIIYQIFSKTNNTPFSADSESETFDRIRNGKYEINEETPEIAQDLIRKLLVKDPVSRLGANNIELLKAHPFFEGIDFSTIYEQEAPLLPKHKRMGKQQQ